MKIAAIIVAAGRGERAGGDVPKQFVSLAGLAVLGHSLKAFMAHPKVGQIHIVVGEGQRSAADDVVSRVGMEGAANSTLVSIAIGGDARQDSVGAGLAAAKKAGASHVLIHDAARPLLPTSVIDRLIAALEYADGAVPVLAVADTLAQADQTLGATVDRTGLVRVQTPQAFRLDAILAGHAQWQGAPATDDAQMARGAGFKIVTVEGDAMLEKITHPADFAAAEARLAAARTSRTGMGYDVHRLEAGPALWLGGVEIAHDKGLAGHSDADVALHALVDALLGAAGDGDIGAHFPPTDPQWRGAPSSRFVEYARDRIAERGGCIDHVDLTIICEAPKIGPHREAMRARIAELLRVEAGRVSVKATTTERLGFTGRGEGIAAQAVATIRI